MELSKEELQEKAKEVFKSNSKEDTLIATSDGQFFLKKAEHLAKDHARQIGGKTHIVLRDKGAIVDLKDATIQEIEVWSSEQTDIEVLEAADKTINSKGGHQAIAKKIDELIID